MQRLVLRNSFGSNICLSSSIMHLTLSFSLRRPFSYCFPCCATGPQATSFSRYAVDVVRCTAYSMPQIIVYLDLALSCS